MGAGLIWAGLGRGLAEAGSTIGGAYMKDAEEESRLQRELKLEELKEQRKIERDERDKKNRMEEAERASSMADALGASRRATGLDKLVASSAQAGEEGDIPLSKEQLQALIKSDPALAKQYQGMGLIDSAMPLSRNQERMQRAEDEYSSAIKIGAHSSVLESLDKKRKAVLDEIKEENKTEREERRDAARDRRDEQRHQENLAQQERLGRQFQTTSRIMQQNADANTTRANNPRSGADPNKPATTADIQRQITAATDDMALELGVPKSEVNNEIASLKKKADRGDAKAKSKLETIQPFIDEVKEARDRMRQFKRPERSDDSEPAPAPAPARTASQSGNNRGSSAAPYPDGTRLSGPGGTYVVRNGKPVLEK